MNNLRYLRQQLSLTYRALEKESGVDRTTLNQIELGKQKLTETRIDALCNFFHVTSDFLLGKTEFGIYLWLEHGFITINKKDYETYKEKQQINEIIEFNQVVRSATKELARAIDPLYNGDLLETIIKELHNLSKAELEKVLKFINDFIK